MTNKLSKVPQLTLGKKKSKSNNAVWVGYLKKALYLVRSDVRVQCFPATAQVLTNTTQSVPKKTSPELTSQQASKGEELIFQNILSYNYL